MKKYLLTLSILFSLNVFAQQYSRLVVFTENGDRFFLYINGKLQNAGLESNVTTKRITEQGVTMRVVFDNTDLGEKMFKIPVKPGIELSCALKKNSKGEYVIRYAGEAAIVEEAVEPEAQQMGRKSPNQNNQNNQNTDVDNNNQENMDVNINMGVGGSNVTYTQKVTTTSSSSGTGTTYSQQQNQQATAPAPKPTGCVAMSTEDFTDARKSVADKSFEDTKVTEAKQILDANCLTAKQVKELLSVFGYEESKLEIAKYAYKKCTDKNNYYAVNSAFGFEASIQELNNYIKSVK